MGKRRRTEIAKIADPAARLVTYSKRRKGLFNKASELCRLCGARAAVVVFSPAGKPCSFGDPSADEIIARYLRTGDAMPQMGLSQWAEWVETEWDDCATEEDLESLILKYEAVRDFVRGKLKALEDDDSRVKVGDGYSHVPTDEEMDSMFESFEGQGPALSALLTDGEGFLTSPENSAGGGGNLAADPTRVPSYLGDSGFDPDDFLNLLEDDEGFLASPEDLAVGGGNLAVEPTPAPSDLGDSGFDPDDFLNLMEDCEGFSTSLEDSAGGGRNLAVDPTSVPSDLGDSGFDPDEFLNLLEDGEGFLTSPEEYWAVSGGSSAADADLADSKSWTSGCEFSYSYMYSVPRVTCLEDILCLP